MPLINASAEPVNFNPHGANYRIRAMRNKLRVGDVVKVKEDIAEYGCNPEFSAAQDRSSIRLYSIKRFYKNYILLQSIDGVYRRGITYFDMLRWGRGF